jgi:ubiquinone/menaquinone biosynthesis C-methylase UbiE
MHKDYEERYHQLELNQFWFKATRKLIWQFLGNFDKQRFILDIGCSGGILLDELKMNGFNNIYGIDASESGINICKLKKHNNVLVMDGAQTGFADNMFDVIIASNVLEHIENDEKAIIEWNRILKYNGLLILFVPAFQILWSHHDIVNEHFRRYSMNEFKRKVAGNFIIMKISYWNSLLFLPALFLRLIEKVLQNKNMKSDSLLNPNPILNRLLLTVLLIENWFLKVIKLPFGISIVASLKCLK